MRLLLEDTPTRQTCSLLPAGAAKGASRRETGHTCNQVKVTSIERLVKKKLLTPTPTKLYRSQKRQQRPYCTGRERVGLTNRDCQDRQGNSRTPSPAIPTCARSPAVAKHMRTPH